MDKELEASMRKSTPPVPLPHRVEDTSMIDRLESSVRSFLLRAATKVNCFYTVLEKTQKEQIVPGEDNEWWLDSDEEDGAENAYTEKHYVALPSIVFSNSENPGHKHHVKCLASAPLGKKEEEQLKFENDVLVKKDR